MSTKVSVIIPTYNGSDYLGEAIQSVLDQTYSDFELIVVDDASPERVAAIVEQFGDERICFIRHETNHGAVAARQTGVKASSGDIIAFLDQDDLFHKQKLQKHVAFLTEHPEYGMTFNARLNIQGASQKARGLWQPPSKLTLADWVLGFPIAPSDVVLRREWAMRDEIWDDTFASQAEHVIFNGQEIVFGGRLALAGCKFGKVEQALNFRRYHPYRILKHLTARCKAELDCQNLIFDDPRCPSEVLAIRNQAAANIFIMWAYNGYIQQEFSLGQEFLKQAVKSKPELLQGHPCSLVNAWVAWVAIGASDYGRQYGELLNSIADNLPSEFGQIKEQFVQSMPQGYLLKAMHDLVWDQSAEAESHLDKFAQTGVAIDDLTIQMFVGELLEYELEFGSAATDKVIEKIVWHLQRLGQPSEQRLLKSFYTIGRAFKNYGAGKYNLVPRDVLQTVLTTPRLLLKKGVVPMLARSLVRQVRSYGQEGQRSLVG